MKTTHLAAALTMAVGVGCGAFGAHALKDTLSAGDMAIWEKAVFYQLIHGLAALVTLSFAPNLLPQSSARRIAWTFLSGTIIFSGSLYALVLSDVRKLGAITPVGGTAFIIGWILLGRALSKA